MAETFELQLPGLAALADVAKLDTMVTVVDAANFGADLDALEGLRDRGWGRDEDDERPVSALLTDQVEFADVLVLNKTDCVAPDQAARVEAVLRSLNPRALLRVTTHARIPVEDVVGSGRFSMDAARAVSARARPMLALLPPLRSRDPSPPWPRGIAGERFPSHSRLRSTSPPRSRQAGCRASRAAPSPRARSMASKPRCSGRADPSTRSGWWPCCRQRCSARGVAAGLPCPATQRAILQQTGMLGGAMLALVQPLRRARLPVEAMPMATHCGNVPEPKLPWRTSRSLCKQCCLARRG